MDEIYVETLMGWDSDDLPSDDDFPVECMYCGSEAHSSKDCPKFFRRWEREDDE